jgi:hypothetical protein
MLPNGVILEQNIQRRAQLSMRLLLIRQAHPTAKTSPADYTTDIREDSVNASR